MMNKVTAEMIAKVKELQGDHYREYEYYGIRVQKDRGYGPGLFLSALRCTHSTDLICQAQHLYHPKMLLP